MYSIKSKACNEHSYELYLSRYLNYLFENPKTYVSFVMMFENENSKNESRRKFSSLIVLWSGTASPMLAQYGSSTRGIDEVFGVFVYGWFFILLFLICLIYFTYRTIKTSKLEHKGVTKKITIFLWVVFIAFCVWIIKSIYSM